MSFLTQRLANSFPTWTKLRRDPSSLGQRFFSTLAEGLEEQAILNKRIAEEYRLFKRQLGPGVLYRISLDEEDFFQLSGTGGGAFAYTYPTVTGTIGATPYVLTRYENIEGLLNAAPSRLTSQATQTYSQFLVWQSSAPETFVNPARPERLIISVSGSTDFFRRTAYTNLDKSGRHEVTLWGTDEDDNEITEVVQIPDDGVYWSRSIFKTLTRVDYEGFDGAIAIRWFYTADFAYEEDPYRVLVLDNLEGQLRLRLDTRLVSSTTYSYVVYETERFKLGELYRNPGVQVYENTEEHGESILLDNLGAPYTAVDLAINPRNGKLCVLDDAGYVHTYDHAPTPFVAPSLTDETSSTYIELHPLQHYEQFGITSKVFTYFARIRYPIVQVRIKRVTPAGATEYLQADKTTWAAGSFWHQGKEKDNPALTWSDFSFPVEYDELGQWEFYCEVQTSADTTVYATAVMVDNMTAESSIDTGVATPVALSISKEGWIGVADATTVTYFAENVDGWVADAVQQRIILHSNYDSVEVV